MKIVLLSYPEFTQDSTSQLYPTFSAKLNLPTSHPPPPTSHLNNLHNLYKFSAVTTARKCSPPRAPAKRAMPDRSPSSRRSMLRIPPRLASPCFASPLPLCRVTCHAQCHAMYLLLYSASVSVPRRTTYSGQSNSFFEHQQHSLVPGVLHSAKDAS